MEVIFKRRNNIYDVVNVAEVQVGESIVAGHTTGGQPIVKDIVSIIESRKSRGTFNPESRRWWWARVETT